MGAWEAWSFGTISPVSTFSRSCRRVPWKTMESVPITPSISLSREDFPGKYIRVLQAPDLLHPVPEYRRDAPEGDQLLPGVEEGGEDRHPCPGPLRPFQEIGDMPLPDHLVDDEDMFCRTCRDGLLHLGHSVGDRLTLPHPLEEQVEELRLPLQLEVPRDPLEDPFPEGLGDRPPPAPPGLHRDAPIPEVRDFLLQVLRRLVLHEPRPRDDDRPRDLGEECGHALEEDAPRPRVGTLAASLDDRRDELGAVLADPVELGLAFLDGEDVDRSRRGCLHGPVDPFEVHLPPGPDDRDLGACIQVDGVVRPLVHTVLDDAADPEPVCIRVEGDSLDPDPQADRFLLGLLGPDLVLDRLHRPEGRGKDEVAGADQVGEVPEVVDALGEEPDLPVGTFHLEELGLHSPTTSDPPGGTKAATDSVERTLRRPPRSASGIISRRARTTFFAMSFGSKTPGRRVTRWVAFFTTAPGGPPMTRGESPSARPMDTARGTSRNQVRSPRMVKPPVERYSPEGAAFDTWSGRTEYTSAVACPLFQAPE